MLRLVIDARMYGVEYSGIGRYLVGLTEEIKKEDNFEFFILLRKKYFESLSFPKNWTKVLADFNHYTFEEQIFLPKVLNKIKPDLVHFPHFNVPLLYQGKFVVTIHDMIMHHRERQSSSLPIWKYFLKKLAYNIVFKTALTKSLRIIVPSETVKKEIIDFFSLEEEKIAVIEEGVAKAFKEKATIQKNKVGKILRNLGLSGDDYFFYVGNYHQHKNLRLLFKAMLDLRKSSRKIYLVIAGPQRLPQNLKKERRWREFLKISGFVSDDDLKILYQNSIAFVYPSLMEGFGLQGLEAMACGTLVLASDIPTFREIYRKNAIFFDPKDHLSLKNAMEYVLRIPNAEREKRISKAKRFVERYSWKTTARKTLRIYEEALNLV